MRITTTNYKQTTTYHIFDNDNREIACHRPDLENLVRLIKEILKQENKK